LDWRGFLSTAAMVALLEKHFFPRWLQVLAGWLNRAPNYTEVTAWFQGWKKELQRVDLLDHVQIKAHINQALQMMNNAVSGGAPMAAQAGALESMRYLAVHHEAALSAQSSFSSPLHVTPPPLPSLSGLTAVPPPPPPPPSYPREEHLPPSKRDFLAKKCAEQGILFVPVPNRTHDGKQVYKCGNTLIYLDRSDIFFNRGGMWLHTDLEELLQKAL